MVQSVHYPEALFLEVPFFMHFQLIDLVKLLACTPSMEQRRLLLFSLITLESKFLKKMLVDCINLSLVLLLTRNMKNSVIDCRMCTSYCDLSQFSSQCSIECYQVSINYVKLIN